MRSHEDDGRSLEALLEELHREVDGESRALEVLHRERLQCRRGCAACCVDGLTVFTVEAARIRTGYSRRLDESEPHPVGACSFLDDNGGCRIYDRRPYVCRTQGLPLRWHDGDDPADGPELRDICSLNDVATEPLESLPTEACWTLGPYEGRLAELERRFNGEPLRRIALRDLWLSTQTEES